MLEIVAEVLANEDHFREDLAARIGLVDDLEIEEEEFLDGVIFGRENVANDCDEELRNGFAIEEEHDCFL